MTDSPDGSESVGDSGDDSQLTIRIPNPKVYLARQSQWKGRRGKPRCDHCRLNNLKCDRVLPTCNHCAYANGRECKYTPLPTPAHRGIPRCDRCRLRNLKCDRNLPVCNHCADESETECNYTPKKRHKVPTDHVATKDRVVTPYTAKTASFLVSEGGEGDSDGGQTSGPSGGHAADGEAKPDSQNKQPPPGSPKPVDGDVPMDAESEVFEQIGPDGSTTWVRKIALPPLSSKSSSALGQPFQRPFVLDQGMIVTTPHIDPWMHPAFAPLPDTIIQTLASVNAIEMPTRHLYDEALFRFISGLSPELRETAAFPMDVYADVAHAITEGNVSNLSPRLQLWSACHHARSGSRKQHLLLLPRDAFYSMNRFDEERLRKQYVAQVDGDPVKPEQSTDSAMGTLDPGAVFERLPVQPQIYDILIYAHRNHATSHAMLYEARRNGFATITWPIVELFHRLCPLCKMRSKGPHRAVAEDDAAPRQQVAKR